LDSFKYNVLGLLKCWYLCLDARLPSGCGMCVLRLSGVTLDAFEAVSSLLFASAGHFRFPLKVYAHGWNSTWSVFLGAVSGISDEYFSGVKVPS
jgi:hypothetical protein